MDPVHFLERFGIALLLGLLVGLQREFAGRQIAGIRTFALITVFGAACGALVMDVGGWIVGAGLLGVAAIAVMRSLIRREATESDTGAVTQVAMLMMFVVGVLLLLGPLSLGVALGGGVAVLLHLKAPLHGAVDRLREGEVRAIMQFVVVSAVILPALPDKAFGPYDVLNPRHIWLMVALIVGISLVGYLTLRFLGDRVGVVVGGLLGGLVSSTATTVSYARRTVSDAGVVPVALCVILIAAGVSYVRVLVEIAAVAPGMLRYAAAPFGALIVLTAALAVVAWLRRGEQNNGGLDPKNPGELGAALIFAAVYAGVLLLVAAVRDWLGEDALYAVAVISGGVDMDAITLSIARMTSQGQIDPSQAWRYIMVATASNMAFKTVFVAAVGARALGVRVGIAFGVTIVAAVGMALLWPGGGEAANGSGAGG